MNIIYKWGVYVNNRLLMIDAQLNTDINYYKKLKEVLKVKSLSGVELIRIGGSLADGHYIMANHFKKNQVAYSFGIDREISWDNAMADKGYQIYMYDHTIEALPFKRNEFKFFKQGLGKAYKPDENLNTLENYIKLNEHDKKNNMVLKIDIEGAEWDFLDNVSQKTLKQFDQIIIEVHNLVRASNEYEKERKINLLNKINQTHNLVHLHGNNTGYILQMLGATFPDVIELTYVNKEKYKTYENNNLTFPTPLDIPNDKNRDDIFLGKWNLPLKEDPFEIEF